MLVVVAVRVGVAVCVGVGVAGSSTVYDHGWLGQSTFGQVVPSISSWQLMTSPAVKGPSSTDELPPHEALQVG